MAANEIRNTYAIITATGTYTFGNGMAIFSTLTGESVTDPTVDRTFEDMGLYVEELGFSFDIGETTTLSIGKLHPVFGGAWDHAAGFFGGTLSEDYELTEQLGILADVELNGAGTLSFGVFFADDTSLSRSWGEDRGRNRASAGGAGNTGELDNFAIQWANEVDNTRFHIGARHLSASLGDVDDEQGFVAGLGHSFGNGLDLFAEVAAFSNFGGTADDASFNIPLGRSFATHFFWPTLLPDKNNKPPLASLLFLSDIASTKRLLGTAHSRDISNDHLSLHRNLRP